MKYLIVIVLCLSVFNAEAKRSQKARRDFAKENICPSTGQNKLPCPGYIIDHVVPLACGGVDNPVNMQWQTKEDAKAKDKWERKDCQPKKVRTI